MSEIRVSSEEAPALAGPVRALASAAEDAGRATAAVPSDAAGDPGLAAAVDGFRVELRGRAELMCRELEDLQRSLEAAMQRYELVEAKIAAAAGAR